MIQKADALLMVKPDSIAFNTETASSNTFQKLPLAEPSHLQQLALEEFRAMVGQIRAAGIKAVVVEHKDMLPRPDAVFPNNWIMMDRNGKVYLFPMEAANRRLERSEEFLKEINKDFSINAIEDWSIFERDHCYLEGTGSMIFDHVNSEVYACISSRTNEELVRKFAAGFNYQPHTFRAVDQHGQPIYHTNVMLSIGEDVAVVCAQSIAIEDRDRVMSSLGRKKKIIQLDYVQMQNFAANILNIQNADGKDFWLMSSTARNALNENQLQELCKQASPIVVDIPTIESLGGGSARCMVAEIFLPKSNGSAGKLPSPTFPDGMDEQ